MWRLPFDWPHGLDGQCAGRQAVSQYGVTYTLTGVATNALFIGDGRRARLLVENYIAEQIAFDGKGILTPAARGRNRVHGNVLFRQ